MNTPVSPTPITELPEIFARARTAQHLWGAMPVKKRIHYLLTLRETLLNRTDLVTDIIATENGKPPFEALSNEILPAVELITYYARITPKALQEKSISLNIPRHFRSILEYHPLGVVAVISPWNYPFMLAFGEIIMALVSGNAVVFKPSEVTPRAGQAIQDLMDEAGIPSGVFQTVHGDGAIGAAIIDQKPNKIFFTGSVATGKKIMAQASQYLIPVNLELGGKDPMVVLADADLDLATSACVWGGYHNSGQTCASVERVIVHESVSESFLSMLKEKLTRLRVGDDLGTITFSGQKKIYEDHINDARARGATFYLGGEFNPEKTRLTPTIVTGKPDVIEACKIYREETFGPVVAVTTFRALEDAIKKANDSIYGLTASVFSRDHRTAERVARSIEAGSVLINEVTYTAGVPETPWGGLKQSGFGRTHSEAGLMEFVSVKHIHLPRSRLLIFKALWWFPYTPHQFATIRSFLNLYRRSWIEKLRALPGTLWNLIQMIKEEKRL